MPGLSGKENGRMRFHPLILKIAAQMIEQRLDEQMREPADLPEEQPLGRSALSLLGKGERPTATEPAPKVITLSGKQQT